MDEIKTKHKDQDILSLHYLEFFCCCRSLCYHNNLGSANFCSYINASNISWITNNNKEVVFEGDSITDYVNKPNSTWSLNVSNSSLFADAVFYNVAMTGDTVGNMTTEYASQVHPLAPKNNQTNAYFFLWAGTNDLYYDSNSSTILP